VPVHCGNQILYCGTWYYWICSMKLSSCHFSWCLKFWVAHIFLENLFTLGYKVCERYQWHIAQGNATLASSGRTDAKLVCVLRFKPGTSCIWGHMVAHMVEALCYKPEGRGFNWNFSFTCSSNRNE